MGDLLDRKEMLVEMAAASPDLLAQLFGLFARLSPEILMSAATRNLSLKSASTGPKDAAHSLLLYVGLTLEEELPELAARSFALALRDSKTQAHVQKASKALQELALKAPEIVSGAIAPLFDLALHPSIHEALRTMLESTELSGEAKSPDEEHSECPTGWENTVERGRSKDPHRE
jgi:hypothetical protein